MVNGGNLVLVLGGSLVQVNKFAAFGLHIHELYVKHFYNFSPR